MFPALRLLGQNSGAGLSRAYLEPSHGRKAALAQADCRSEMWLNQVASGACSSPRRGTADMLGLELELATLPPPTLQGDSLLPRVKRPSGIDE